MRTVSLLESSYNESCWLWGLWNIQRNRDCRCCSWRLPFRAVSTTNTTFIKMLPNISDTIKTKLLILLFRFFFLFLTAPNSIGNQSLFPLFHYRSDFPSISASQSSCCCQTWNKQTPRSLSLCCFWCSAFCKILYLLFSLPSLFLSLCGLHHILHVYRFVSCISKSTAVRTKLN